jgi:hypothetical protein
MAGATVLAREGLETIASREVFVGRYERSHCPE